MSSAATRDLARHLAPTQTVAGGAADCVTAKTFLNAVAWFAIALQQAYAIFVRVRTESAFARRFAPRCTAKQSGQPPLPIAARMRGFPRAARATVTKFARRQ